MNQWIKKCGSYLIFLFVTSLICIFFDVIPHHYTLEFTREFPEGEYSSTHAEFLYFDGEQWGVTETSASVFPQSGVLRVSLTEPFLDAVQWRIDPVNEQCRVIIGNIVLKDNGFVVKQFDSSEILQGIEYAVNISEQNSINKDKILLAASNEDPYIEFSAGFVEAAKGMLQRNWWSNFFLIFLPIACAVFLLLFHDSLSGINKNLHRLLHNEKVQKLYPVFFTIGLLLFAVFLYRDYLFGNKLFVYKDVGADSYNQTYPYYMYRMRYYAENGSFPKWSFQSGLGNSMGAGIYDKITALFGYEAAPMMLVIFQIFKLMMSGVFFFAYLRTMGMANTTSTIFAFSYAFCGHMTVRAAWSGYPGEVMAVAILLWAFEQWFMKKRWFFLPAAILWLFQSTSTYFSLLYLGILCGYAVYRYHTTEKESDSWIKYALFSVGILLLGVGLTGSNPVKSIFTMAENPRISGDSGMIQDTVNSGLQWMTDVKTLAVMVVRSLAPNALGIDIGEYQGVSNYLTDPVFYCGILALLVIPQLFVNESRKKIIWHGIVLAFPIIYMVCPVFRNAISGFTGDYQYRMTSFWVIVVLLCLASQAFEKMYQNDGLLSQKLFLACGLMWVLLLATEIYVYQRKIDNVQLYLAMTFLLLYLLIGWLWKTEKTIIPCCLLGIVVIELYVLSYDGINQRNVLLKSDLDSPAEYNDATIECVAYLKENDGEPMYRLAKDFYSVYLCDSLIQDYNGLTSYQGGTSHSGYLLNFIGQTNAPLANMGMSKDSSIYSTNFMIGFNGYSEIKSMLSTKYMLSKQEQVVDYGYEKIAACGDVNIFENRYSLPFGYLYDSYLPMSEYGALDDIQKRKVFTTTCVVDDTDGLTLEKADISSSAVDSKGLQERVLAEYENIDFYETISFEPDVSEDRTMLVSFDVVTDNAITGILCYATDGREPNGYMYIPIAIQAGEHHYLYELSYTGIDSIRIATDREITGKIAEINNVRISTVDSGQYYVDYINGAEKLQQHTMDIQSFRDDEIIGEITAEKDAILFFSIPYSTGWKAYVDGEETVWENVNIGFSGIQVSPGTHKVELRYAQKKQINWQRSIAFCVYFLFIAGWLGSRYRQKKGQRLSHKEG